MKRNFSIATIVAVLVMMVTVMMPGMTNAQTSNLVYSSQRMPQMNYANPALFPSRNNAYLILPSANIRFGSPLSYNNLIEYNPGDDTAYVNFNHILDTLSRDGRLILNSDINLLGLGVKVGKIFVTLGANAHIGTQFGLPRGLCTFLNEGNMGHLGAGNELYLLDGDLLNMAAYVEAGLGVGVEIIDGITVGARVKVFDGYFNASTADTKFSLYTAEDMSEMRADLNYQIRTAGCFALDTNMLHGDFSNFANSFNALPENYGIGIDLGARWETRLFDISASIQDLFASITWKENVRALTPANGGTSFTFSGIDVSSMLQGGNFDDSEFSAMMDSLLSLANTSFGPSETYRTFLPTKFNLSGMYKVLPWLKVGAMMHGEIDRGRVKSISKDAAANRGFRSTTSLVGSASIGDWLELVANVAVVDDGNKINWFNPGVGFSIALGKCVQMYGLLDYLSSIYLVDAKSFNISFGMNLMIVNRKFHWVIE